MMPLIGALIGALTIVPRVDVIRMLPAELPPGYAESAPVVPGCKFTGTVVLAGSANDDRNEIAFVPLACLS